MTTLVTPKEDRNRSPVWHRAVFAIAAAPLLLFALVGWEHGAYLTFGILGLVCFWCALRPTRAAAAILFSLFTVGACIYGWLLASDVIALSRGGAPVALVDADDSIVFVGLELTLIGVSALLFLMWRPFRQRNADNQPGAGV
jgi:hypothetical protein